MNRTKPYLNKLVLQKQLEITDSHHLQNMKQMKPITSRLMEHSQTIIINHRKGQKLKEVREIEIQRQNQSLLGRMSSVLRKEGSYSPAKLKNFRTKVNKSLNQIFRKKQQENIALQNERFQARLVNKKPTLNLEKIDRDWKQNKRVMKKMSNCQFYLTTFRPKETKDSPNKSILGNSIEIRNKLQVSKLTKIIIIDDHKLQIKIEYSDDMLKIIGKLVDSHKVSQIIEIPKKEAINFLIQDCGGKIENILPKLRYDGKNGTLYIISNYQEEIKQSQSDINPEKNKNEQNMQKQVKFELQSKTIKHSEPKEVKQVIPIETVRQNTINNDQINQQKMTQKKEQPIWMINQTEKPNDKQQQKLQLIALSQNQQQKQVKNQQKPKNQLISQHEKQPQQEILLQQTKNDGQTNLIQNQVISNNNFQAETPGV